MDRGQIPQEPSFLAMELRRTAEGLHLAYEEFKRAGFTRRGQGRIPPEGGGSLHNNYSV